MLRPSSTIRILIPHPLPPPPVLRTLNALSALRRRTPPAPYRTRRSVATIVAETPGIQHSILTHAPVLKDIEDSEYDTDLIPPEEAKLEITQRAAEVRLQFPIRYSLLPKMLPSRSWTPVLTDGLLLLL